MKRIRYMTLFLLLVIGLLPLMGCDTSDNLSSLPVLSDEGTVSVEEPVVIKDDGVWTLTQYSDFSGNQGMFYSLYNASTGCLVLIDGGWKENAEQVRSVIMSYGGKVDHWFITHYHNDHVDAFNVIMSDLQGIRIENIYDSKVDYDLYESVSEEWDMPDCLKRYQMLTEGNTDVKHLHSDDVVHIGNLTVDVFNSCDTEMEAQKKDLPNNLSLVLRIAADEDSLLICGDCHGKKMGNALIERYGDRLKSKYVQTGHHGNNSLRESFYDAVQPEVAFFDAPEWLITDEKYSTSKLMGYFEENGVKTYDYRTSVNQFTFR